MSSDQRSFREIYQTLTGLQQRFVDNVLADPTNNAEALRKAGSKATRPKAAAHEMMKNPNVREALAAARREAADRTEITLDRVLNELAKLGFSNMLDYGEIQEDGTFLVNLQTITRDQGAAIQEATMEVVGHETVNGESVPVRKLRIKLADKKGALELIGKHLGMFTDKVKHEFPEGMVGVVLLPDRKDSNGEQDG